MYFAKSVEVFVIELNTRQGGRFLPSMVQEHNGIDYYRLLVSLAVSDESYYHFVKSSSFTSQNNYVTKHIVFAHKDGILSGVKFSSSILPCVKKITRFIEDGSPVKSIKNGTHAIAMVDMKFDGLEQQKCLVDKIEEHIYVEVRDELIQK